MEELDIKRQFHLLQEEVEAAVSLIGDVKLNEWIERSKRSKKTGRAKEE